MLPIILIKVLLDEYTKDFAVNLVMVWKTANSKTWEILASRRHFVLQDPHLPTGKGHYKGKNYL